MSEVRLIDANALKKAIEKYRNLNCVSTSTIIGVRNVMYLIDNAPTVEERPIRCKDCKHTVLSEDGKTLICCLTMKVGTVRPNFYCGNGEMKGGKEE